LKSQCRMAAFPPVTVMAPPSSPKFSVKVQERTMELSPHSTAEEPLCSKVELVRMNESPMSAPPLAEASLAAFCLKVQSSITPPATIAPPPLPVLALPARLSRILHDWSVGDPSGAYSPPPIRAALLRRMTQFSRRRLTSPRQRTPPPRECGEPNLASALPPWMYTPRSSVEGPTSVHVTT